MAFASLTIDLNARIANIERDLGRAAHVAETQSKRMENAFKGAGLALGGLGGALSVGALASLFKTSIDSADALNDLAVRTGTSVEALASLKLAAQLADTDLNALGDGMGKLSIFMARNAEEAKNLGITARDPAQAMAQLADVIASVNDPSERNALAMKVLGKSYSELMPLLAQGGDEIRRQASDSAEYAKQMAEMAKQAGEFNDRLDELKQSASAAGIAIAGPVVTALNNAANQFKAAEEQGGKLHAMLIALGSLSISAFGGDSSPQGILESQIAGKLAELKIQKDLIEDMQGKKDAGVGFLYYADDRIDSARQKISALHRDLRPAIDALEVMRRKTAEVTAKNQGLGESLNKISFVEFGTEIEKAFSTAALDKFTSKFSDVTTKINAEYAALQQTFGDSNSGPVTSLTVQDKIVSARSAIAGSDSATAKAALDAGKAKLRELSGSGDSPTFELQYLADQLKELELQAASLADFTQLSMQAGFKDIASNLNSDLSKIRPEIELNTDLIQRQVQFIVADVQRQFSENKFVIPIIGKPVIGSDGALSVNLSDVARKLGGR